MSDFKEHKKKEFLKFARELQIKLEALLGEKTADDYIYINLRKLISEVEADNYPKKPRRTDIGIVAVKEYDLKDPLAADICEVAGLYRKLP